MEQATKLATAAGAAVRTSASFAQWEYGDLLNADSHWITPVTPRLSPMIEGAMGRRSNVDTLGENDGRES